MVDPDRWRPTTTTFFNQDIGILGIQGIEGIQGFHGFHGFQALATQSVPKLPRTIRLVYASVSILSVCAVMLRVIVIQTRWTQNDWRKSFIRKNPVVRHVTRPCPCMTTWLIIKTTRVISMWTPHWITVGCHSVESPMTTGYYCAIFPFCGGGKKTKTTKGF